MDLVYRPRETPVLKMAKDKGVPHIVEGIEILLEQVRRGEGRGERGEGRGERGEG